MAAYLRNRRFTRVSIVADRETLGKCIFDRRSGTLELDRESYGRTRERIETLIVVSLAGVVSESLLTGRKNRRGAHTDLRDAAHFAGYVVGDEQELNAYLRWLWARTRNLLRARPHWAAVRSLARALLANRSVGERRARQVIADALNREAWRRKRRAASRA